MRRAQRAAFQFTRPNMPIAQPIWRIPPHTLILSRNIRKRGNPDAAYPARRRSPTQYPQPNTANPK